MKRSRAFRRLGNGAREKALRLFEPVCPSRDIGHEVQRAWVVRPLVENALKKRFGHVGALGGHGIGRLAEYAVPERGKQVPACLFARIERHLGPGLRRGRLPARHQSAPAPLSECNENMAGKLEMAYAGCNLGAITAHTPLYFGGAIVSSRR